jgi:hypothetical protein
MARQPAHRRKPREAKPHRAGNELSGVSAIGPSRQLVRRHNTSGIEGKPEAPGRARRSTSESELWSAIVLRMPGVVASRIAACTISGVSTIPGAARSDPFSRSPCQAFHPLLWVPTTEVEGQYLPFLAAGKLVETRSCADRRNPKSTARSQLFFCKRLRNRTPSPPPISPMSDHGFVLPKSYLDVGVRACVTKSADGKLAP